jgi:hypothetical protein
MMCSCSREAYTQHHQGKQSLVNTLYSSTHARTQGSIFPSAMVGLYCTYLCFSALQSEPKDYACNGLAQQLTTASGACAMHCACTVVLLQSWAIYTPSAQAGQGTLQRQALLQACNEHLFQHQRAPARQPYLVHAPVSTPAALTLTMYASTRVVQLHCRCRNTNRHFSAAGSTLAFDTDAVTCSHN